MASNTLKFKYICSSSLKMLKNGQPTEKIGTEINDNTCRWVPWPRFLKHFKVFHFSLSTLLSTLYKPNKFHKNQQNLIIIKQRRPTISKIHSPTSCTWPPVRYTDTQQRTNSSFSRGSYLSSSLVHSRNNKSARSRRANSELTFSLPPANNSNPTLETRSRRAASTEKSSGIGARPPQREHDEVHRAWEREKKLKLYFKIKNTF